MDGAPLLKPDLSNKADVVEFVDKYITCRLPNPDKVDEVPLFSLVRKYQTHKHTATCQRKRKGDGKKSLGYCRFGFPRLPSRNTVINKPIKELVRDRFRNKKPRKMYLLKRSCKETDINDYNPDLLFAWKAKLVLFALGCLISVLKI